MAFLLILIPLLALIVLNLPGMRKATFGVTFVLFVAQIIFAARVPFAPPIPAPSWLPPVPLILDTLSAVMLIAIGLVCLTSLLVGQATLRRVEERDNLANLLLIAFAGLNGSVMASDLFSLYVFIEVAAVASFILIASQGKRDAISGAFKYIVLSCVASALMLSSIGLLLMIAGDTSYAAVAAALKGASGLSITTLAVGLFLCGLFIKGGVMPFHGWLPDAYTTAPAAVSVLLAGIVTKTSGVYTLIRLVSTVFGFTGPLLSVLLVLGALSAVAGALAALSQKDMKRMLAFSSISQMGYILIGLGCGTPLGVAGAIFHLFNHATFKTQLFVNAAAVEEQLGTRDMEKMGGLAARMPITGATSVVGLLSTAGVPPLAGFWSKLTIVLALWGSGHPAYAALAMVTSVVTLGYFLLMQRRVFFGKLAEGLEGIREARAGLTVPAVILSVITVAAGIGFPFVLERFILPASNILR